ncbi:tRNA (adenosine(37)-N6)-dimethylallyltransferase MiaA [Patescibacteria group bacterium]|nr:tRNA (adenosine(37)-N6)-dimethylallyltransferase MiaA [Patescibacteria group bacterium]
MNQDADLKNVDTAGILYDANINEIISDFLKESEQLQMAPLLVILGPTASGKTGLSIQLAKKFGGEIVSADSRQVYKYMDIGTAKICNAEMDGIPHYMLDIVNPDQEFTLADYVRKAKIHIDQILKKGKLPMLVGGTGLYIRALCDNYQIPRVPPNNELRSQLQNEIVEKGEDYVYEKLKEVDPINAEKIHPHNHRYVIRAIEIAFAGKQKQDINKKPDYNILKIGINWDREKLYERIDKRAEIQIEKGLVNETKTLIANGFDIQTPAMSSLGYPEIFKYINGELSLDEALELFQRNTRNYAKRQLTWFRRETDVVWIPGEKLI